MKKLHVELFVNENTKRTFTVAEDTEGTFQVKAFETWKGQGFAELQFSNARFHSTKEAAEQELWDRVTQLTDLHQEATKAAVESHGTTAWDLNLKFFLK